MKIKCISGAGASFVVNFVLLIVGFKAAAADVNSVASGRWEQPSIWSNGQAPEPTNDYHILSGDKVMWPSVSTEGSYIFSFSGRSMKVEAGGVLDLVSNSKTNNAYVDFEIPDFSLEDGATLKLGLQGVGNIERRLVSPVSLPDSGQVIIEIDGYSGGYSNRLELMPSSVLSGAADILLNIDSTGVNSSINAKSRRYVMVRSENNPFSGDWIVSSINTSPGVRIGGVYASGKNALGTGGVFLTSSLLSNEVDGGLDSLREVVVGKDSIVLLNGDWNGPSTPVSLKDLGGQILLSGDGRRAIVGDLKGVSGTSIKGNASGQSFEVISTNDTTFSGLISGAGLSFIKSGDRTLIFDTDHDYAGGTIINSGTLQLGVGGASGGITGDVISNGVLSFNRSDSYDFTGSISGSGEISQVGSGVTTLSGASAAYSGVTSVSNGTLLVNGVLGGGGHRLVVHSGGVLGGVGSVGGGVTIEDGVLSPGKSVGTLNVLGDLSFVSSSVLNYEFGEANVVGGILNDLTNVGGALVLDGVLNVNVDTGSVLQAGVYRIINYNGALSDNGLSLGSLPAPGAEFFIQTSIPQEVNLIYTAGYKFNFWDGELFSNKNNGSIEGGSGVWQSEAGNDHWTNYEGVFNAPFNDAAFSIFSGKPGVVTVDQGLGDINISGAQFATSGYQIKNGTINMVAANTPIFVGDGTESAIDIMATIDSQLTGSTKLTKIGMGTLVLNGDNSYTNGTRIGGGTLQISSDKNLGKSGSLLEFALGSLHVTESMGSDRPISIERGADFVVDGSSVLETKNEISGAGYLVKSGQGAMILTGGSSYSGTTLVSAGRLEAGGVNKLSPFSIYTTQSAGILDLNGYGQSVAGLINAGAVLMSNKAGVRLNVDGDYVGRDGVIEMATRLGDDQSTTDQLVINGNSDGITNLRVRNAGGQGALTYNGIKIIDVQGDSVGDFNLIGDYTFDGEQAVIGGAYAYRLVQNSFDNPTDGDWYLRSTFLNGEPSSPLAPAPYPPILQPGVPLYESYASLLLSQDELDSYQQRTGGRQWLNIDSDGETSKRGIWLRTKGSKLHQVPNKSTSVNDSTSDVWKVQLGATAPLQERAGYTIVADFALQYSQGDFNIDSLYGDGAIESRGYGALATLTWQRDDGLYIDSQLQAMWYESDLSSKLIAEKMKKANRGLGTSVSAELGKPIPLGDNWSISPQAQLTYSNISYDDFSDAFGAVVELKDGDSLQARVGVSLDFTSTKALDHGSENGDVTTAYGIVNLYQEMLSGTEAEVSGVSVRNELDKTWAGIGVGVNHSWAGGRYTVFGELEARSSLENVGESYGAVGSIGVNFRW
ncbi:autotransporter outer membrane beta-barrel domain-containing protein [Ectopseudomonas mendocina]|uniref:Autotransporter outer membrane beta-barrel domain-containing protein n=1 Tax=Ectopseudomonas mendocina TaxID=300 RepID=A0ABZ2RJI1_ECTME